MSPGARISRRSFLAAFALAPLLLSTGCSVGIVSLVGDSTREQEAQVTGSAHPETGPGTVDVLVECRDGDHESKVITVTIPEEVGAWKAARLARTVLDKEGPFDDRRIYHRVEVETNEGWVEAAEVDGYVRPSSVGTKVIVAFLTPVAAAFDVALLPIYIWGAVFVKFILPEKPLG